LFDAARNEHLLTTIVESMPLQKAQEYLGATRVLIRLLHDEEFIKPFVRKSPQYSIGNHLYAKEDLD
jgi:hypothetical protein